MCGRYDSFLPAEFIARLFSTVNALPNLEPTWNDMQVAITVRMPTDHARSETGPRPRYFGRRSRSAAASYPPMRVN